MTTRTRALRQLSAAAAVTVSVTLTGVLLGPGGSSALASGGAAEAPAAADTIEVDVVLPSVPLPDVAEQRHADFTIGDGLPDGARVFNTGGNTSGMALAGGLLAHGAPEASGAAGFVETRLASEVALLGARVRFPATDSGSVALVGWQSSLVGAHRAGGPTPSTGLRLVASPGRWELTVVDGDVEVIGSGSYEVVDGPATFEVRRVGGAIYVVDPTGAVTVVKNKRAARLAGTWASWGLSETGPEQTPASLEAVWAG